MKTFEPTSYKGWEVLNVPIFFSGAEYRRKPKPEMATTWQVLSLAPDCSHTMKCEGDTREECIAVANNHGWTMQGEPVEITIMKDAT